MNKEQYLKDLESLLSPLPESERKDILYDYKEYFFEGINEGKSEDDIIKALGSPEKVAKPYLKGLNSDQKATEHNLQDFGKQIVDRTKEFVDRVSVDGKEIGSNIAISGKKVGKELSERGKEIGENLKETGKRLGTQFKGTAEDVGKNIKETTSKVVENVKESTQGSGSVQQKPTAQNDAPMATHEVKPTSRQATSQTVTRVTASEQRHVKKSANITTRPVAPAPRPKANHPIAMIFILFGMLILTSIVAGPYLGFWGIVIALFAVSIVLLFGGFAVLISSIASVPIAIMNISIALLDHPVLLISSSLVLLSLGGLMLILTYYFGKGLAYIGYYYIKWTFRAIRGY